MYTIGKLSKNTGVTVRTLDYYDEIGLLTPSAKTDGGHRLYDEEDVMRLERILALKYMGFSLEQIKDILQHSPSTWQQSIQQQLEMVKREQERLKTLEQTLLGVYYSIEFEKDIDWSMIFSMIKLYQQDPEDIFQDYQAYLTDEDMRKIIDMNAQMSEEDIKAWTEINETIKKHLHLDPYSDEAWQLAERWISERIFGHDEALLGNLTAALSDLKEGVVFYPITKDVVSFIEHAYMAKQEKGEIK
nr:MerR family transcriptional regulator [Lentibacillus saliphilus]